ncbi:hypothetical protein KPL70_004098 [Citrus sinensis]|nr:hypothetical protein KPL70_004098 [Citrus sinensis]
MECVASTSDDGKILYSEATTVSEGKKGLTDVWPIDSGATYHMTSQKEWFHTYKPISEGSVYMGDDHALEIVGISTIKIKMFDGTIRTIEEIRHVKGEILQVADACVALNGEESTMIWHLKLAYMSKQSLKILSERKLLPGLKSLDMKTAFLHGELEKEIYMLQPEGFAEIGKKNLVCRLNKFLYSLKQVPRLDIAQAMGAVSPYMANPSGKHWKTVKRILRYIRGTSDVALCYGGLEFTVRGYVDSDFAGDLDKRKSTTGYVFTLVGATVSWVSKLQTNVALSTTKAEYMAATQACKEAIWIQRLLEELGHKQEKISVFCDS